MPSSMLPAARAQSWTPAEAAAIAEVAALAADRFADRAARYDAEARFPLENYQDLHASGLLALGVPEVYGGRGIDGPAYGACLLELAKGCSATALTFTMHTTVLSFVGALGTEAQRRRYFAEVVQRGARFASCTSEPGSSFRDTFVVHTRFYPVPGGYRVVGVKHFCSLGEHADYYLVSGLLAGHESARDGMVGALIPRDRPGLRIEHDWSTLGMRGTVSDTVTYDCEVAADELLGQPGEMLACGLFIRFPFGYAATYLGIAEAAFAAVAAAVQQEVVRGGAPPATHDARLQRLGAMATQLAAARLLLDQAGRALADPRTATAPVNMAKYAGAEAARQVTDWGIQMRGGSGILKRLPLERWYRDATAGPVMPPHNDRCLETIGGHVLGLDTPTLRFQ